MPASSKKQWRFMGAVASGKVRKKGLSRNEARDILHKSKGSYGDLPAAAQAIKKKMGAK